MERLVIKVKDGKKGQHLVSFLEQLDFVEIQKSKSPKASKTDIDLFRSAGIWKDKTIDAKKLRSEAWKIKS